MSGNLKAAFPAPQTPFSSLRSVPYCLPVKQMRSLNTMIWIVTSSTILNTVSNPFPSEEKPQEAVTQLHLWVTQHDAPLLSRDSTLPVASISNELQLFLAASDLSEMSGPWTLAIPCWSVSGEGQGTPRACPQPAAPDPRGVFQFKHVLKVLCSQARAGCPAALQPCVSTLRVRLKLLFLSKSLEIIHVGAS